MVFYHSKMALPLPSRALILFDSDGLTTIVETKKLYGSVYAHPMKDTRCIVNLNGKAYVVEILDLSDDEGHLEDLDTEWSRTDRAIAIQSERDRRKKVKRSQKYGGYLDIVPPEKSSNNSPPNTQEATHRNTRGSSKKRKQKEDFCTSPSDQLTIKKSAKKQRVDKKGTNTKGNKTGTMDGDENVDGEKEINYSKPSTSVQEMTTFNSKIDATSITLAGKNLAWISYFESPSMYLYNSTGSEIQSLTLDGTKGINDMAITKSGDMILVCGHKEVRSVTGSGISSTIIESSGYYCTGLCITEEDEIAVCMKGEDLQNNHVAIYSKDGYRKLREIRALGIPGNNIFTNPYNLVEISCDMYVVNFCEDVVCVTEHSKVKWIYDGKKAKLKYKFSPHCICVDKYKNLLVSDSGNHCLHYIDRDGGLISVILTEEQTEFICHWGICVDDATGQVWCGNTSKDVVIAKYLE